MQASNLGTGEVEAGGSGVQDKPGPHEAYLERNSKITYSSLKILLPLRSSFLLFLKKSMFVLQVKK